MVQCVQTLSFVTQQQLSLSSLHKSDRDMYCMYCVVIFSFSHFTTARTREAPLKTIHDHVSDYQVIYGSLSNTLHLFPSFANGYSDRIGNVSRQNISKCDNFYQTTIENFNHFRSRTHELAS